MPSVAPPILLLLLAVSSATYRFATDNSAPCIWAQKELTYRVFSHPILHLDIIRQALDKWEDASDFKFQLTSNRTANFYFKTFMSKRLFGYLRNNVIYISRAHLDPIVLMSTVLHEVGHLLGLKNSNDTQSIMYEGASIVSDIPVTDTDLLRRTYVDRCKNRFQGFTTLPNGELVGLRDGYYDNGTHIYLNDLLNRRGAQTWDNVYVTRDGRYRTIYEGRVFDDQGKMVLDMTRHLQYGERITAVQSAVPHDIFYTNHKRAYEMGPRVNVSNTEFMVIGLYHDFLIDTDYMLHGPTTRPMREVFPELMCDDVCDSEMRPPYRPPEKEFVEVALWLPFQNNTDITFL